MIPDDEKVNRIFVNLFDETQIDRVLSENLQGFQYEIVNHFSMTGSYVVEFDSITAAEEAVTILNTLEEVNYAEISVKIRLIE